MHDVSGTRAIFAAHRLALADRPGGLQVCTKEFQQTLTAAGFDLLVVAIDHDATVAGRLRQRLGRRAYPIEWQSSAVDAVVNAARDHHAEFVFLNLVNLAPMAESLRPRLAPECRIALLSHGLESVDYLHERAEEDVVGARTLGALLFRERTQRHHLSHVVCVNPFEVEIERWLGAPRVGWVPRTIPPREPLAWDPAGDRIGYVGTLDHPPNRDGLREFLEAFAQQSDTGRVRIIGGPEDAGRAFASSFEFVDYLGALPDPQLEAEARTWSATVHPLFCWARGVSTKLATALAWHIPIVTTPQGARGYEWREGGPVMAATADACATRALDLFDPVNGMTARSQVSLAAASSPTVSDVASRLRQLLCYR